MNKSSGVKGQYQNMMPVTRENIGKDLLKAVGKKYPHSSNRQAERLRKQAEKKEEKRVRKILRGG